LAVQSGITATIHRHDVNRGGNGRSNLQSAAMMRVRIDTTMRFARSLLPQHCVLTIRYPETTLFASLIRHVVRSGHVYIRERQRGGIDRGREREREIETRCTPPYSNTYWCSNMYAGY